MNKTYVFMLTITVAVMVTLGISWDVYRWHTFQKVTDSNVGYFKWKLVIDGSTHKSKR